MQEEKQRNIEVCFTPALFPYFKNTDAVVVIVDILRATSSICAALENGARSIIPVATIDEAKEYKSNGYMVAAERDGYVLDFADFGNSPFNFTPERVAGRDIVYSTTNGTYAIHLARDYYQILVGSFLNISVVKDWILRENRDVIILCAGWKYKFNLEDTLFAGALSKMLMESHGFGTVCDSTFASIDLWDSAKNNLMSYISKVAQHNRLKSKGLDDCIEYCHTFDQTSVLPMFKNGFLIDATKASAKEAIL